MERYFAPGSDTGRSEPVAGGFRRGVEVRERVEEATGR
jgi:hypothetical protein